MMESGTELIPLLNKTDRSKVLKDLVGVSSVQQDFDMVFLFRNPFPYKKEQDDYMEQKLDLHDCKHIFKGIFKMVEKKQKAQVPLQGMTSIIRVDSILTDSITNRWTGFAEEHPQKECKRSEFLILVMNCLFDVLQNNLQLELKLFYSRDKDEIFCKIRSSQQNLKVQADLIDYKFQLKRVQQIDQEAEENLSRAPYKQVMPYGVFEKDRDPEKGINSMIALSTTVQVEKEYKIYNFKGKQIKDESDGSLFRYKDRVRIIQAMLTSTLDLGELMENNLIEQQYILHDLEQLAFFRKEWGSFWKAFKPQPIKKIRSYFGEKIGMYFQWVSFYTQWLIVPAILGLSASIIRWIFDDLNDDQPQMSVSQIVVFAFSMTLALYSSIFDRLWIRKQRTLSWMWGTYDIHQVEEQRSTFKGEYQKDEITGRKKKISFTTGRDKCKRYFGYFVSLFFVLIVIGCVLLIFYQRAKFVQEDNIWGVYACATVNACQIKIMNFIFGIVATKMNNWENYEYDSQYYDALTFKLYMFQFVNSYLSLFYIAFAKEHFEGCQDNDCMAELRLQLTYIFLINISLNFMELGLPYVKGWWAHRRENKQIKNLEAEGRSTRISMTYTQKQSKLDNYENPINDYMELVINFGYIVMFSSAFPMVPFLFLFYNIIEIRVDAFKLCNLNKRPYPSFANTIGYWKDILRFISLLGALTNTGILIFTTNVFDTETTEEQWAYFIVLEHILLLFRFYISGKVPETPKTVTEGLYWGERIANERIYGKSTDVDKQKELRNLKFSPIEGVTKITFDPEFIGEDNK